MPSRKGEKGHKIASLSLILIFLVIAIIVSFIITQGDKKVVIIKNQNTNKIYLKKTVLESDTLIFGWIHSYEHIPWNEYYQIQGNNKLLLNKIEVAGFGAGIPNNKGIVSIDDSGMIIMNEINEIFDHISWIHSQSALDFIKINSEIIVRGPDFPHHENLILYIKDR